MKVLFVGDIVGKAGRLALADNLVDIQLRHKVDLTIVNVENAAGGFGITPSLADEMFKLGVDAMTSGNHVWDRREVFDYFPREPRLLRPGNYPPGLPGQHCCVVQSAAGIDMAVINLQGRVFMPAIDCPFRRAREILAELDPSIKVILIDFHAEATSEKMAFGWHLDGSVSAIVGTHTHVPTADAWVLPQGTAYVTDVGMTGSYHSVIGMRVEGSLKRFLTGVGARFEPASESPRLCAVVIDIDEETGQARSIERCDRR